MTSGTWKRLNGHPWEDWFKKKKPFTLTRGVDYTGQTYAMAIQFRQQAKNRNVGVHISISGESMTIAYFELPAPSTSQGKRKDKKNA